MDGVRVVEVGLYVFGPGAGTVLADWGADVVKVEHPEYGDPLRSLTYRGIDPGTNGFTYLWEIFNRGKRSIGIDLSKPDGRHLLLDLVHHADVFLTNFLPSARRKLGIDVEDIVAANPRIIYARGSGYGTEGPEADKGGYDDLTYWYRTGIATGATPEGSTQIVNLPGPAFGDAQGGVMFAAGIAAALFQRERTGQGTIVDASLLGTGMWAMQPSLVAANMLEVDCLPPMAHADALNPISNVYRTADGRYVALNMLQADRYWAGLCEMLGRPEMATDPRFATMEKRRQNRAACVAELDSVFAAAPLVHWINVLSQQEGQWEYVRNVGELNSDAQAWANGYLQEVKYDGDRTLTMVPFPIKVGSTVPELRPAPELGAHTEEILLESGLDWSAIAQLKAEAVIT